MKTFRLSYLDADRARHAIDHNVPDDQSRNDAVIWFHATHQGCTILHLIETSDPNAVAETGTHPDDA